MERAGWHVLCCGGGCHGVQRMGEVGSVGVQSGAHILWTGSSFLEMWRVTAGLYWDYRVGACVCVCAVLGVEVGITICLGAQLCQSLALSLGGIPLTSLSLSFISYNMEE